MSKWVKYLQACIGDVVEEACIARPLHHPQPLLFRKARNCTTWLIHLSSKNHANSFSTTDWKTQSFTYPPAT